LLLDCPLLEVCELVDPLLPLVPAEPTVPTVCWMFAQDPDRPKSIVCIF
jgi:hypothetical protein